MLVFGSYSQGGGRMVEGLGDEEIPWWIAPYVRNFAEVAKSQTSIEAQVHTELVGPASASLTLRLTQTAAIARVAVHVKGNEGLAAGVSTTLAAEIDEFCGTPPRPHDLNQAGLAVSVLNRNML